MGRVEVQKKPYGHAGKSQVGDDLSIVDGDYSLDSLDFYDHLFLDQQIQPVSDVNRRSAVHQGHWFLAFQCKPAIQQLECQARLV